MHRVGPEERKRKGGVAEKTTHILPAEEVMTEEVQEFTFLLRKGDPDEKDFAMDSALGPHADHRPGMVLQLI
jgi:hypothetical protein